MASWQGAAGAGLRTMRETGSRSTASLAGVEGLQRGRGELEGNVGKHLVAQYVDF